ncbi:hypothetical protein L9F63_025740, partial [Diploptera punctata]
MVFHFARRMKGIFHCLIDTFKTFWYIYIKIPFSGLSSRRFVTFYFCSINSVPNGVIPSASLREHYVDARCSEKRSNPQKFEILFIFFKY